MFEHGTHGFALPADEPTPFIEALDALGRVRWRINPTALDTMDGAWARSLAVADLPSRHDLDVPPALAGDEMKALRLEAEAAAARLRARARSCARLSASRNCFARAASGAAPSPSGAVAISCARSVAASVSASAIC